MSSQFQGRPTRFDLIEDLVDAPSSTYSRKILSQRTYSNYSSLPAALNKHEYPPSPSRKITAELRDRLQLTLPRSNSSSIMMNNDERRRELDLLIKQLYDGKIISSITDDQHQSETRPLTSNKHEKEISNNHLESFSLVDGDITILQRELQERELDIIHLRKEVHELQAENQSLKTKVPLPSTTTIQTSNNQEIEAIRYEKGILQNDLRTCQELVAKLQHQNHVHNRSKQIDESVLQQKEALEQKLKMLEKQIRILMHENEKFKRHSTQIEGFIDQLKGENQDLQQKLNDAKKRNEELFYQEFNSLRNDLKILKQRNNELFDENLRLQQQRSKLDAKQRKNRTESPNMSETSDSTNYLTTVNVDHYHNRPSTAVHRSLTLTENSPIRSTRHHAIMGQEDLNKSKTPDSRSTKSKRGVAWVEERIHPNGDVLNDDDGDAIDDSKPTLSQSNHSIHRSIKLDESPYRSRQTINQDDRRQIQRNVETVSPRRPFAPSSIRDIHLNDTVKFTRPGGKISKGVVKYIGALPDKNDQYLGLELEDEESKHDGIYQDQRLFHCKPNRGVFVAFNKVIMAWSER